MTVYQFDTNAGPILRVEKPTAAHMRSYVERGVPLLRRRGYTHVWTRSGRWHVMTVSNSKGRRAHACAFRPLSKAEDDAWPGVPR